MKCLSPFLALTLVACAGPQVVPSTELMASLDADARTDISATVADFLGEQWTKARIDCADGRNGFVVTDETNKPVDIPMATWQMDVCTEDLTHEWLDAKSHLHFEKHGRWELVGVG